MAQRGQPASLAGVKKPRREQGKRVGEPESGAGEQGRANPRSAAAARPAPTRAAETSDDPGQAAPFVGDREEALGEDVHQRQHDEVGGDEGDAGADDAERGDEGEVEGDVGGEGGGGGGEVELGAAGSAEDHDEDHVEGVEGDAGGDQADRLVGAEELGRGEGANDPAREQPHAGDDEGAAGGEQVTTDGVGAAGFAVVADRVGQRRPGELEAADEDVDALGELDRERVEARLGEAGGRGR